MTVGELANKMRTTVRTLQHYDHHGLLTPSSLSAGGRRLYSDADLIRLHQIQALKSIGFSLTEIRDQLFPLDDTTQLARLLRDQATAVRAQIAALSTVADSIDALAEQATVIGSVDFHAYAAIISASQGGNELYWVLGQFTDRLREQTLRLEPDVAARVQHDFVTLSAQAQELVSDGVAPDSEVGVELAGRWWRMVLDFSGGDLTLIADMERFEEGQDAWNPDLREAYAGVREFVDSALSAYFATQGAPEMPTREGEES